MNVLNVIKTLFEAIGAFMADDDKIKNMSDGELKRCIALAVMYGDPAKAERREQARRQRNVPIQKTQQARWSVA